MGFTEVTITAAGLIDPDGSPATGMFAAVLDREMINGLDTVVPSRVVGTFVDAVMTDTVVLEANDDTGTSTNGALYSITLQIDRAPRLSFKTMIHANAPVDPDSGLPTVSLADLIPQAAAYIPFQIGQADGQTLEWHALTRKWLAVTPVVQADVDAETARATAAEATKVPSSQVGQPSGLATLDAGGKLTSAQIPALAITDVHIVASDAAMLAIGGAHQGTVAIRTDLSNQSFMHNGGTAGNDTDWTPIGFITVASVNGHTGVVTLAAGDVGADPAGAAAAAQTAAQAASLQRASNLSDIASASTARTNLGLGTAATHPAGDFDAAGAATTAQAAAIAAAEAASDPVGSAAAVAAASVATATLGQANGVATLDSNAQLTAAQIPDIDGGASA